MPVMIRNNDATELCITKGQEGFVVGWQSSIGPHKQLVLDTLFVELDKPPKVVKIPGLPDNVVPIVRSTKTIECVFPSDVKETIERQQVFVIPNFAMTAHAAQGKTRPQNVVHLNSCFNHMAYYSSLSRSATAAGTVILQGFDSKVITRGCTGYLRQEFRELEILDDVTRLKYEKQLPDSINGNLRHTLINQYQVQKGKYYVPCKTDAALVWSENDPLQPLMINDMSWKIVDRSKPQKKLDTFTSSFVPAQSSVPVTSKRKKPMLPDSLPPSKRSRLPSPTGLVWDRHDYSCAYDFILVILYDLWKDNSQAWSTLFESMNDHLSLLSHGFVEIENATVSFEQVRDHWRSILHNKNPREYPRGHVGISVAHLSEELFKVDNMISSSQHSCTGCEYSENPVDNRLGYVVHASVNTTNSTKHWIDTLTQETRRACPQCRTAMTQILFFKQVPPILVLEYSMRNIVTSHKLEFRTDTGIKSLTLRGIVYHGHYHFTSRVISRQKKVWYLDGISTGNSCIDDGSLDDLCDNELKSCRSNGLVLAIYAQEL